MQKIDKHKILPDQRTLSELFSDACRSPSVRGSMYLIGAFFIMLLPLSTPIVLVCLMPAFFTNRVPQVPLRLPMEAQIRDPNDPLPGGEGFHKARGAVYLGNERGSGKEAWVSWNDQRLHDYVLGTTGSGKTETILAINANFVFAGSGFLMGDGKGTMMFPKQTATLARIAGADDDHFVISFLSGYKDQFDRTPKKRSNSINPFGEGNAATVKELLTSLMSDGGGDNAIFADGAASLADSLSPAWVEGRDKGLFEFDITYISQSLALPQVYKLSQLKGLSKLSQEHIRNYLLNLGYDFDKSPNEQPENCTRMHGYYVNYFMRTVTSFAISYRHIYLTKQGEVNLRDTVQSHRCLTFTLPSLEKSGDEVSNLGKTLLVSAKAAASFGLGESMEGTREEAVENLPANYPIPYKFNFDEFSFYVMENFSLMPAQLRGINISCLMGAQDFIGTERAGEIDAESILANARTKMFGGLEDIKTWEKVKELVGEVDMLSFTRFNNKGSVGNRFVPDMEVQHTRRAPLEIQELQEQVEGQFHVLQRGRCSKIKTYYPNINEDTVVDNFYLNRLVSAYSPTENQLHSLRLIRDFVAILSQKDAVIAVPELTTSVVVQSEESAEEKAIQGLRNFARKTRFSLSAKVESNAEDAEFSEETTDNASTETAETSSTSTPEADIPEIEDSSDNLNDLNASIDEWGATFDVGDTDNYENSTPANNEENESLEREAMFHREQEDLLAETQVSAEAYFQSDTPAGEGVFALTDSECIDIEKKYESLGLLLGDSEAEAKQAAADIVNSIRKKVFYIIPPKPNANKNIKAHVDALMKQADLFE